MSDVDRAFGGNQQRNHRSDPHPCPCCRPLSEELSKANERIVELGAEKERIRDELLDARADLNEALGFPPSPRPKEPKT